MVEFVIIRLSVVVVGLNLTPKEVLLELISLRMMNAKTPDDSTIYLMRMVTACFC